MRDGLAVVPKEPVKAFAVWVPGASDGPEPPLTKRAGGIPATAEYLSQCDRIVAQWMLPLGELWKTQLGLFVASNLGVPEVFAGHQNASRGSAYWCTAVMLSKTHPGSGESIEVWGLQFLLAVAAQFSPS
jgi:hypothetical protein